MSHGQAVERPFFLLKMKKLRWQLLVVLLALAAIGALLVGQKPNLLPEAVPAAEPIQGGEYSEALIGSLGRLNPLLDSYNSADHDINRLLFSGLVRFDDRGSPQGDLAETWGISQDGTVYNFSIRADAFWHDGHPVTSDDIVFTVELLRNEELPIPADLRDFWNQVEVKLLDDKTIQFRLPEPFAPFMDYLSFGMLPQHILGDLSPQDLVDAPYNLQPIGSGPYQFDHLIVEDKQIKGVVLTVFPEYYGQNPYIEQIVFMYYPDSAAALAAYQRGEVKGISHITADQLPAALKIADLNMYTGRLPRLSMIILNLDDTEASFFQESVVRRALLMSLNRQWIVDRVLGGQAIVANGPILPGTWAYYDGIEQIPFDPDLAVSALKEAGYTVPAEGGNVRSKEGKSLAFEMVYPDEGLYAEVAQAIQGDWSRLGVEVALKPVTYEELVSDYLETRNYQAALLDLNLARSPDPDPYPFWHQAQISGGQNYANWDDRQASEYLEQARVQVDPTERMKRYRNFQVRFTNEMPALPLYYPVYSYGVNEQVQGVNMGPLFDPGDRFSTITSWFLSETETTGAVVETAEGSTETP